MESQRRYDNETTKKKNGDLIVHAAQKLFVERNFNDTSMDDVAKMCGLTKRTVYKHFISKEDLFFAVILQITKTCVSFSEAYAENGANALEKVKMINNAYCLYYIENPELFRLMNYQPDNIRNCEESPNRRELLAVKDATFRKYEIIIEEGKQDGSINAKLDTEKSVYFGIFAAMGLLSLISNMDKSFFWRHRSFDEKGFLSFSMDLLAEALTKN